MRVSHRRRLVEEKLLKCYTDGVASELCKLVLLNGNGCRIEHPSQRQTDCLMMEAEGKIWVYFDLCFRRCVRSDYCRSFYEQFARHKMVPAYTKELMKVHKKYLRLLKGLQRDSTHRKMWKTMKRLKEEEDYDEDESIDSAVNERKLLLQRMLTYAVVMDNSDADMDHE